MNIREINQGKFSNWNNNENSFLLPYNASSLQLYEGESFHSFFLSWKISKRNGDLLAREWIEVREIIKH